jgi:hypothetical protein
MYRDLAPRVKIIALDDREVARFMQISPDNNYLVIGHKALHERLVKEPNKRFDSVFYEMAKLPLESKWNEFCIKRDRNREEEVVDLLGLRNKEFIFVHDDASRNLSITKNLPKDIKIVRPDRMDISIFDYLGVIERAREVHCIDSSFMNLIDCIQLRTQALFFHKYVKIHLVGEGGTPTLKLPWEIYE